MVSTDASVSVSEDSPSSSGSIREMTSTEEWTARDTASVRLQLLGRVLCCRNKPRIRWIRSKGAILVLLWNCLSLDFYGDMGPIVAGALRLSSGYDKSIVVMAIIQALSVLLLYPLAGWIADVYFGRYRVIKASLWLMWTGTILLSSSLCVNMLLLPGNERLQTVLIVVLCPVALLAMELGIAGFKANVIPFGIDQLSTGSGDQLSAFITWFVFTFAINGGVFQYFFSCPWLNDSANVLLRFLFQAALLSATLILDFLFKDWFIVEPQTSNPFKLVATVLRYAWKNKQPQRRSAFTYQDHTRPSRIDFAKQDFGGPFTTEEVENVKTFLRIVYALVPMGALLVLGVYFVTAASELSQHISPGKLSCFEYLTFGSYFSFFIVVFAIPLYEFFVHPILHNYIPTMLTRFGIGIILYIFSNAAFFIIDLVTYLEQGDNTNYTCISDEPFSVNRLHLNPLWTLLPLGVFGLGMCFTLTSISEFVFSQSPYNMKGLLMGAVYAIMGAFQLLGLVVEFPFYMGYAKYTTAVPSCNFLHLLVLLALAVFFLVVYVLVARSYRKREREETKRQQNYSEEYYSKYLRNRRR